MGALRNFGYFINIVWILVCLVAPYGIFFIWIPIIFICVLRHWANQEKKLNEIANKKTVINLDLRDLAQLRNNAIMTDKEQYWKEHDTRVMTDKEYKKYLENKEKWK